MTPRDMSDLLGPYIGVGLGVNSGVAQAALQNAANYQNGLSSAYDPARQLAAMAMNATPKPTNVTPIRSERTPEEIQAQLEARYAEMQAEAERMKRDALTACSACRWNAPSDHCQSALIKGFGIAPPSVDRQFRLFRGLSLSNWPATALCGPEKALWEPRLAWWQKLWNWFIEPWRV